METKNQTWHDLKTNLVWELKTSENVDNLFVWSKEYADDAEPDAHSYVEKLNEELFGGFDDWRLPTVEELKDFLTKKETIGLCSGFYWSSTTSEGYKNLAWYVHFNVGGVVYEDEDGKNVYNYVLCVRTGQ